MNPGEAIALSPAMAARVVRAIEWVEAFRTRPAIVRRCPPQLFSGGTAWAKIVTVGATTFTAKLVDANGNVGTNPEFTCNVLASGSSGLITSGFTLSNCAPKLTATTIVPVLSLPAAGSGRPAGYWLAWYVTDTCT